MSKIKYASLACGTLAVAITAAHFMQSDNAPRQSMMPAQTQTDATKVKAADQAENATNSLQIKDVTLTSALPSMPEAFDSPLAALPAAAPAPEIAEQAPLPDLPQEESVPSLNCEYILTAKAEVRAMVRLTLNARCLENERFTLHHNGMMFTGVTDAEGQSEMLVPALSTEPVFIAAFLNGEGAVANAKVPAFTEYDRRVVQWKGPSGLQLHALEGGAEYGDPGHIWAGADQDKAASDGFLVRLGNPQAAEPLMADVYSFPSGAASSADVAMSVEAEVTRENCGQDIEAQTLEFSTGGEIRSQDLTLSIPDCDAVGDFLVLKNLLDDLKIAGN